MKNIIFIGTKNFASHILEKMIKKKYNIVCSITKNDKNMNRGLKITPHEVKKISLKYNIPTLTTDNINNDEIIIKKLNPDIIIITEYSEKIKQNIINIPKYGIINIHPSLLPKFRGPTPIQSAIINELNETGVSIIKINEKYDKGNILNKQTCKINKNETYDSLSKKLKKLSIKLLFKTLKEIKTNTYKEEKQKNNDASITIKIEKNFYLINWEDTASLINKKIRSTFGIAKHHSFIENNYINIIETVVLKKKYTNICSGTIIKHGKYGIDVNTGCGILRIKKVQFPGKKINIIKDVLNSKSYLFKIGNIFKNKLEKK
ncbi:MAG TPA: methionyl-tRNA formyltransferase [Candidatus Azoamicus sp.]